MSEEKSLRSKLVPKISRKTLLIGFSLLFGVGVAIAASVYSVNILLNNNQNDNNPDTEDNFDITDDEDIRDENDEQSDDETDTNQPGTPTVEQSYQVFFRRNSEDNEVTVESVTRKTDRSDIAAFLVEEYIKGPSGDEKNQGYFNAFSIENPAKLNGESDCNNRDFQIDISEFVAIVRFCKTLVNLDAGATNIIEPLTSTLKQFATVKDVVILNKAKDCVDFDTNENNCMIDIPYSSDELLSYKTYMLANLNREGKLEVSTEDVGDTSIYCTEDGDLSKSDGREINSRNKLISLTLKADNDRPDEVDIQNFLTSTGWEKCSEMNAAGGLIHTYYKDNKFVEYSSWGSIGTGSRLDIRFDY